MKRLILALEADASPRSQPGNRCWRLREPFCGLSHLVGVGLSVAALAALLPLAAGRPRHLAAFSIYGLTLILVYTASTLYHSLRVPPARVEQLRALDEAAIYGLIAGTYTPVCLLALRGAGGDSGRLLLAVVWGVSLLAALARLIWWRRFPRWLSYVLYFTVGCSFVVLIPPIQQGLSPTGFAWLLTGVVLYAVGAISLALERPRLWPGVFDCHDLWHLFVLGGSACHFVMIRCFVAAPS